MTRNPDSMVRLIIAIFGVWELIAAALTAAIRYAEQILPLFTLFMNAPLAAQLGRVAWMTVMTWEFATGALLLVGAAGSARCRKLGLAAAIVQFAAFMLVWFVVPLVTKVPTDFRVVPWSQFPPIIALIFLAALADRSRATQS